MRGLVRNLWVVAALAAGAPAVALEDAIVLQGRFEWIVPRQVENQYPSRQIEPARKHFIERVAIQKGADGKFVADVTLPRTLTGGQTVTARYKQTGAPDEFGAIRLANPQRPSEYLECYVDMAESWREVNCNVDRLRAIAAVTPQQRANYLRDRYGNTDVGVGLVVVAGGISGAEPGGKVFFFDADEEQMRPWLGRWNFQYRAPNGQTVRGTMELDGYTGIYRPTGSSAKGVLSNLMYEWDGAVYGAWEMNGTKGWLDLLRDGTRFTGGWGYPDDNDPRGSWDGNR